MVQLLKGEIKKMSVDKLEISKDARRIIRKNLKESVIKKDALFYVNRVGREINFEFDTYLCTRTEAEEYLLDGLHNDILFVDYEELKTSGDVSKRKIKEIKKEYKNKR